MKSKVFAPTIGYQQGGHVKKAASLPRLAHKINYSEKVVQGMTEQQMFLLGFLCLVLGSQI